MRQVLPTGPLCMVTCSSKGHCFLSSLCHFVFQVDGSVNFFEHLYLI